MESLICNAEKIYNMGMTLSDDEWSHSYVNDLVNTKSIPYLMDAGQYWSDVKYNKSILNAIIKHGSDKDLYDTGVNWSDDRFHKDAVNAFIDKVEEAGSYIYLLYAGIKWSDNKYDERFLDLIIKSEDIFLLCEIGTQWDDDKYSHRVLDALIECSYEQNNSECLFTAGTMWNDDRYDERILQGLIDISDPEWLQCAGAVWPNDRYSPKILEALINSEDQESKTMSLFVAVFEWLGYRYNNDIVKELMKKNHIDIINNKHSSTWHDDVFFGDYPSSHIDRLINVIALISNPLLIYYYGIHCTNKKLFPIIGNALYKTNDEHYINEAKKVWHRDMAKYICKRVIEISF